MFTHVMIGSNDLARAKVFYDAVFAALGGAPRAQHHVAPGVFSLPGPTTARTVAVAELLYRDACGA